MSQFFDVSRNTCQVFRNKFCFRRKTCRVNETSPKKLYNIDDQNGNNDTYKPIKTNTTGQPHFL